MFACPSISLVWYIMCIATISFLVTFVSYSLMVLFYMFLKNVFFYIFYTLFKTIATFVYAHPVMCCLFKSHTKLVNKQYGCLWLIPLRQSFILSLNHIIIVNKQRIRDAHKQMYRLSLKVIHNGRWHLKKNFLLLLLSSQVCLFSITPLCILLLYWEKVLLFFLGKITGMEVVWRS